VAVERWGGGVAAFYGHGSPLSQAQGLGLDGPVGYLVRSGMTARPFYPCGERSTPTGNTVGPVGLVLFIASHAFSQGSVIRVYISEIFPNRARAAGQAPGGTTHRAMAALVSWTFPISAAKSGGGNASDLRGHDLPATAPGPVPHARARGRPARRDPKRAGDRVTDRRRPLMRTAIVALALALTPTASPTAGADERRPLYHFTPPTNFINDPNGLVYLDGEYHLFYQHNPEGDRWGHMSWGHAVSRDLVRWEHLPIALREENGVMIFSGSAVLDPKNTSGLGREGAPPMVAVYTGAGPKKQTQNLASSLDRGRTWAKFAGNPVLDLNSNSFRDPKVFWHEPTGRWVMATVLADERKVRLWASTDLKTWERSSDFGPAGSVEGVWECPELFEAPVEGPDGGTRWVLKVDVNAGAPSGGSGGQYFVGRFDGKEFRAEGLRPGSPAVWVDHGKDFYAAQAWNDAPAEVRPVWIAWMNNWQYANEIPTSPWRGAMTVPRRVALRDTPEGLRLVQAPVEGVKGLRGPARRVGPRAIGPGDARLSEAGVQGAALEIVAEFEPGEAEVFGLKVRQGPGEETVLGFDRRAGEVFVDRTRSGEARFSPHFAGRHAAKLTIGGGDRPVRLHVLVDATSVEVFADGGRSVVTDQIFPKPGSRGVSLFATGGTSRLRSLEAWELRP
jgi:fructan beta-fructosidase